MKGTYIRLVSIALIISMLVLLAVGCTTPTTQGPTTGTSGTTGTGPTTTAEPLTGKLSYWIELSRMGLTNETFDTVAGYAEMERILGIEIDWIHPPVGQEAEAFSLLMASPDLPDMIYREWVRQVPGGPSKALEDGIIIPLNDIFENNAPNMKALLEELPTIAKEMMTDDGSYYVFPNLYPYWDDVSIQAVRGNQIRQDWLEELNLEVPETIDDWYNMLKAFKAKGVNDAGDPIYPLVSRGLQLPTSFIRVFANAWNGLDYEFYVKDGVVKYGPNEPEFEDYLNTMRLWYQEGLIDPEFATFANREHDARITNNQGGAWHSGLGAGIGVLANALGSEDKIVGAPYPVINRGDTPYMNNAGNDAFRGAGTVITTNCKNPLLAARYLDFRFSEEGRMLINWGVEGVSYTLDANGLPQLTDLVKNDPDGLSVDIAGGKYFNVVLTDATVKDPRVDEIRYWLLQTQRDASAVWDATDFSQAWPFSATLTAVEGRDLAEIMSDITTYQNETVLNYMLGANITYAQFVSQIREMGIERAIQMRQDAYDRYRQRVFGD